MDKGGSSGDDDEELDLPSATGMSNPDRAVQLLGFGMPPRSRKRHALSARFSTFASAARSRVLNGYIAIDTPNTTVLAHTLVQPRALPVSAMDTYLAGLVDEFAGSTDRLIKVLSIIAAGSPLESVSGSIIAQKYQDASLDRHAMVKSAMRWAMRPMVVVQELDAHGAYRAVWEKLFKQLTSEEQALAADSSLVLMVGVEMDHYPDALFADSQDYDAHTTMFRVRERIALVHLNRSVITSATPGIALPDPHLMSLVSNLSPPAPRPVARLYQFTPLTGPRLSNREDAMDTGSQSASESATSTDDDDDDDDFDIAAQVHLPHVNSAQAAESTSGITLDLASPLSATELMAALPPLPQAPLPPRPANLALPTPLQDHFDRRTTWKLARYCDGRLAVQQASRRVLANQFVPPRALNPSTLDSYLATLKAQPLFRSFSPAVIQPLLKNGFGQWMSHADLRAMVSKSLKKSALDAIHYSIIRPAYIVAIVDRTVRPDMWDAVVANVDRVDVPESAQLALLLSVECRGLEEPTAGTPVLPMEKRKFTLRERVAIVTRQIVSRRGRRQAQSSGANRPDQPSADEDADAPFDDRDPATATSLSDSEPDSAAPSIARHSNTPPALADSQHQCINLLALPLALTGPIPASRLMHRYRSGQLQVSPHATVLADQLATMRNFTTSVTNDYIQIAHTVTEGKSTREIFTYAIKRGPMQPFTMDLIMDAMEVGRNREHRRTFRKTVVYCMVRPLFVVGGDLDREQYAQVYEELVAEAVARGTVAYGSSIPKEARLVRLLGLEMCGFEYPHAEDALPAWEDRRFVIRERYALVV
ncbi:hypothetical protein BCR44DRAFT_87015 [Catenaria anguillulae PL171]|uniref:Uncharacterized protein n=1 Tax=Catenaria anguillulae PL171 TaxID=765915 RepID=A0A1Y2H5W7_9FUNG|nr:hypothetical protein BCR44DRAFT_87015 [Catenaria anguillulae PL171]